MKKKPLKLYLLLLVTSITLATITALACAGGDWDEHEGSMFAPEIINQPTYSPFFRTNEYPFYTGYDDEGTKRFNPINTKEWYRFFDSKISEEALNYWLYTASLNQIDSMIFNLKDKPANLTSLSKIFSLKPYSLTTKTTSFLYYVGFAKRNEAFATKEYEDSWNTKPKKVNTISADKQIAGGLTFYVKATDVFLKERYGFQLMRLYFYNKNYEKVISFYKENESSFKSDNSIKWRTMGYLAGSYYKLKNYSQSNYLYSLIFNQYEPLQKSAYLSFHPLSSSQWDLCLNLAKTTTEKEVLWQLAGLYTDDVMAMREIIKLNPKSELVDLLLVRAINIEEEKMESNKPTYAYQDKKSATPIKQDLIQFLNTMSDANTAKSPAIWHLSAAYLNYMNNSYDEADKQLKRAEKLCQTKGLLKSQYHLISALGKLKKIKNIDAKAETDLLSDLKPIYDAKTDDEKDLRYLSAQIWMRQALANLLIEHKEFEKAELVYPGTYSEQYNDTNVIKNMITYYNASQKSEFEKLFIEQATLKKDNYLELLAIRYAQLDLLDASINTFKLITTNESYLLGNPFTIHIKDCHDCDHAKPQKNSYTSLTFIEKMKEMKTIAQTKPIEAAQNYFLVANGFYNMTYFGNARLFFDNDVDNTIYEYEHKQVKEEDCALALNYYLLAKNNSTDKEFRAKCTFMAAKCEQNAFFMNIPKNYKGDFKAGKYFTELKNEYSSTKYFDEVLQECGYFKTYMRKF